MPFSVAQVYAYLGDRDVAFAWLDKAFAQRDPELHTIKGEPLLDGLKPDLRFKAYLRKMNLPD